MGSRRGRGPELQRSRRSRPLQARARSGAEGRGSIGRRFAQRAGLHPGDGEAISGRPEFRSEESRRGLSRRHAAGGQRISRRSRRRHALRRVGHEPASLGPLASGRNSRSGHGRNRRDAGIGDEARSQPSGRDPLLHPCGRSVEQSRARARRREQACRARARRRTHRAHARARLHPHRRLRSRGQDQRAGRGSRSRLHQGERRAGHLSDDVLQPQPALRRHVRRHERPLRRGAKECRSARRQRRSARERHAAARRLHDDSRSRSRFASTTGTRF